MDSDENEIANDIEEEWNPKEHAQLVENVLSLNKKLQLKKPSRTEPTLEISEFSLVKSITGTRGSVNVNDLTKVLKKGSKHTEIGNKVLTIESKSKTLPKPLEKPQAERIRRTVAYENVKKQLDRWDAVVTSNRGMNHLSFPLKSNTKLETGRNFTEFRLKSDLLIKLEQLERKNKETEVFNIEKESKYPLTMQEMLERRKEGAKMRAVQSYKEAKARRQNKIKSKKFHRIQRKENIKNQLKEFEQLQKTNPEEALKKLEEIERVRAEERASLRHRSTSKWAKNKQIRAKYDKESRQILSQQLTISRDLTQKLKVDSEDSDVEVAVECDNKVSKNGESNPWINTTTPNEVEEFVSGYRKFWESAKKNVDIDEKVLENTEELNKTGKNKKQINGPQIEDLKKPVLKKSLNNGTEEAPTINSGDISLKVKDCEKPDVKSKKMKRLKQQNRQEKTKNMNKKPKYECLATTLFQVDDMSDVEDSDNNVKEENDEYVHKIIDRAHKKLKNNLQLKYKKLKKDLKNIEKERMQIDLPRKTKIQKKKIKLDLNTRATKPIIDEELLETDKSKNDLSEQNASLATLNAILKNDAPLEPVKNSFTSNNINPDDIIKTSAVTLNTNIPDLFTADENEENADQQGVILEAFEDDDIVNDFQKDKETEIDKNKPSDVDLNLPGWGSWGGVGINPSMRKTKRFIMKFPKKVKRRDENKGDLIINENADSAGIKAHLVSEVPFPFKSVKDYEASIRAPVGNTFIPETAYRKMIRPAITTKMGTIIEPMTDEILLKKKK